MGRIIWGVGTSSNKVFNVDISEYPMGIYYIRFINELDKIEVKKLVKQ